MSFLLLYNWKKFIFARLINETLYKSDSKEAHEMMQKDRKVFEEVRVLYAGIASFLTL